MSEDMVGARGKRLLNSKFFAGGIYKDDLKYLIEFKSNCSRKGTHMSYDGTKRGCAWATMLKRNNRIERILLPIAEASKMDVDVFIDEVIDEFLDNVEAECVRKDLANKVGSFRKDTISKVVNKIVQ